MESRKGYTIEAANGVVAMALDLRCQVWWFKPARAYVIYRVKWRVRGW
jgi:hypothetical protein